MIDLRSDMLGHRSAATLQAMAAAAGEAPEMDDAADRHKRRLEEDVAGLLGMEAALFLPTCTMANQIAIRLNCRPGDAVLAEAQSHLVFRESDSAMHVQQVRLRTMPGERGHLPPRAVAEALVDADRPKLVWLENTHNMASGTVMPAGWQTAIADACRARGVPLHLDGSRLWNASVASGEPPADLARGVDSVAVSLNKAVDAPVGALLLGRAEFIGEAAGMRRALGGYWRPIGLLAAAARAALHDYAPRIAATHRQARRLALQLAAALPDCTVEEPETNIVIMRLPLATMEAPALAALRQRGVAALGFGGGRIRFVLHSGIDDASVDRAATIVAAACGAAAPALAKADAAQ